jgi:glycosyltransferase involved in cell wall biosynthesis
MLKLKNKGMKICVFPNDPLKTYYEKGEIKERYFNPKNIFDEVHIISLFDEEINEEKVKTVAGNASFKIHTVGKVTLINKNQKKKEIIKLIKKINPNVIRSFNPLLQGWIAAKVKQELKIPLVISLHGDYDRDLRYQNKKNHNYKKYFKLQLTKIILEKYSLSNADEVIIIYNFIRNYAKKMGAKKINLIYNKVDLSQFSPKPENKNSKPIIICVGRLIKEKNQECLINAVKDLDVKLLLIGNGTEYNYLKKLVKSLHIENKVQFETSIQHENIASYYNKSDIFALPIKYGGFAIPALEAAASGIPVILPKQEFDPNPDLIKDFALLVDNNPQSFKIAIQKILSEKSFRDNLINNGLNVTKEISSDIIEEKEKKLYLKLLDKI